MNSKGFQPRRTLFVGGISSYTTEKMISQHFKQFARVSKVEIMKHKKNKAPKGFAYVTLADASDIPNILSTLHTIDGRKVDCQVAANKKEKQKTKDDQKKRMIYVTNLPGDLQSEELHTFFEPFGQVRNAYIIFDNDSKISKRFGYVEFLEADSVINIINRHIDINNHQVLCLPYLGRHEKKDLNLEEEDFQGQNENGEGLGKDSSVYSRPNGDDHEAKSTKNQTSDDEPGKKDNLKNGQVVSKDNMDNLKVSIEEKSNNKPRKYEFLSLCARLNQSTSNYKFNLRYPTSQMVEHNNAVNYQGDSHVLSSSEPGTSSANLFAEIRKSMCHEEIGYLCPVSEKFFSNQLLPLFLQ